MLALPCRLDREVGVTPFAHSNRLNELESFREEGPSLSVGGHPVEAAGKRLGDEQVAVVIEGQCLGTPNLEAIGGVDRRDGTIGRDLADAVVSVVRDIERTIGMDGNPGWATLNCA